MKKQITTLFFTLLTPSFVFAQMRAEPATITFCFHQEAMKVNVGVTSIDVYNQVQDKLLDIEATYPITQESADMTSCRFAYGKEFASSIESDFALMAFVEQTFNSLPGEIDFNHMHAFTEISTKNSPVKKIKRNGKSEGVKYFCQRLSNSGAKVLFRELSAKLDKLFSAIMHKHDNLAAYGDTLSGLVVTPKDPVPLKSGQKKADTLSEDAHLRVSCDSTSEFSALYKLVSEAAR